MSDTLEQAQERARLRSEAREKAREEQLLKDLQAKEALEEEHPALATVNVARHIPGQPTMAIVKTPNSAQYKRFRDMVSKAAQTENAKAKLDAVEMLAQSCWVYPAPAPGGLVSDEQKAMVANFPGILVALGGAAAALAEGSAVEEGKG